MEAGRPALPDPAVLREIVEVLHARGDSVSVVRVVEAWAADGEPDLRARLRQALALHRLRLVDRAMTRTLEVLRAEPRNPDALRLLADVYLDRGWPTHARRPLGLLREMGVEVDHAWLRAHAEPVRPELQAHEIEREGAPARLLALAEAFLATGSLLRARGLLERLRRHAPTERRARELLWAMDGDFAISPVELHLLVDDARLDASDDATEHTETVVVEARGPDAGRPAVRGFPALFADGTAPEDDAADGGDVTQSSAVAGPALTRVHGDAAAGDTQIMLVIRPGERLQGPAHRLRDVTDAGPVAPGGALDLAAWTSSMGMRAAPSDLDAPSDDLLEAEDADVVVVTRHERPRDAEDPPDWAEEEAPIEVVERRPVPDAGLSAPSRPAAVAAPAPEPLVATTPVPPPSVPPEDAPPPRAPTLPPTHRTRRSLLLAGGALLAAVTVGLAGLVVGVGGMGRDSARTRVLNALAPQEPSVLATLESTMRTQPATTAPDTLAALATVRAVLWAEYDPARHRREAVESALANAVLPEADVWELRARLAAADGDTAALRAAGIPGGLPRDEEDRLVRIRVALALRDVATATALAAELPREAVRHRLTHAEVMLAAGRPDDAIALLRAEPTHPFAAAALGTLLATRAPYETAAPPRLPESAHVPPRIRAVLAHARAARALREGDAPALDAALSEGLAADPTHDRLRWIAAARTADQGRLRSALDTLDALARARPDDPDVRRARVLVLLDLDRVDAAARAADAAAAEGPSDDAPVLAALVARARGEATAIPAVTTALAAWADARAALDDDAPDATTRVQRAVDALDACADPWLRPRARALRAHLAYVSARGRTAARVAAALAVAPDDSAVHLEVARAWERADESLRAAQHYDRAVSLGPEQARAWLERARFYADALDAGARARESRARYLALEPSGPRAEPANLPETPR
ncbi:MAG: hypothetical protein RLZZ299_2086 [Pseudomonadota bacterium]